MGKLEISKGQFLHRKGDTVKDIAIILKGSFTLCYGDEVQLTAGNGAIIGAFHPSGGEYEYDYKAAEDCTSLSHQFSRFTMRSGRAWKSAI